LSSFIAKYKLMNNLETLNSSTFRFTAKSNNERRDKGETRQWRKREEQKLQWHT